MNDQFIKNFTEMCVGLFCFKSRWQNVICSQVYFSNPSQRTSLICVHTQPQRGRCCVSSVTPDLAVSLYSDLLPVQGKRMSCNNAFSNSGKEVNGSDD